MFGAFLGYSATSTNHLFTTCHHRCHPHPHPHPRPLSRPRPHPHPRPRLRPHPRPRPRLRPCPCPRPRPRPRRRHHRNRHQLTAKQATARALHPAQFQAVIPHPICYRDLSISWKDFICLTECLSREMVQRRHRCQLVPSCPYEGRFNCRAP